MKKHSAQSADMIGFQNAGVPKGEQHTRAQAGGRGAAIGTDKPADPYFDLRPLPTAPLPRTGLVPDMDTLEGSAEHILPRGGGQGDQPDSGDPLPLFRRLESKKKRMPIWDFAFYAHNAICKKVQTVHFDLILLLLSVGVAVVNFLYLGDCKAWPSLPAVLAVCCCLDAGSCLSSLLSRVPVAGQTTADVAAITRAITFLAHAYGVVAVYMMLPPETLNRSSSDYCHQTFFWSAFVFCQVTAFWTLGLLVVTAVYLWRYY